MHLLPWKKMKKNTKLSQMLSDSINQRRKSSGSPLVVETGFPTSLVDLFVKNKERLKKPRKKNNDNNKLCSPPPSSPPLEKIDYDFDDNDSLPLTLCSSPSSSPFHPRHNAGDASRAMVVNCECEDHEEGVDGSRVLVAILRMFLVVVLVLCAKKFVVGITMSAFVLVFLECLGKHSCRLSRPCTWVMIKLRLIMNYRNGNVEEVNELQEESSLCLPSCSGLNNQDQDPWLSNRIREIDSCLVSRNMEIECEEERIDGGVKTKLSEILNSKHVGFEDEEKICEKREMRTRKSRRDRIKLKMKELVPKKLRPSRNKGREVENREGVLAGNVAICEKEEEDSNGELSEFRCDSDSSSMSREIDDVSYSSDKLVDGNITPEGKETETKKKSGYVVLVLIVLVGLIGGRVLALVLALSWCLMTKSGGTGKLGRYIKAPFLGSPVIGSS